MAPASMFVSRLVSHTRSQPAMVDRSLTLQVAVARDRSLTLQVTVARDRSLTLQVAVARDRSLTLQVAVARLKTVSATVRKRLQTRLTLITQVESPKNRGLHLMSLDVGQHRPTTAIFGVVPQWVVRI
jgi:hypothetical protein